jgi:hypothetical protein
MKVQVPIFFWIRTHDMPELFEDFESNTFYVDTSISPNSKSKIRQICLDLKF